MSNIVGYQNILKNNLSSFVQKSFCTINPNTPYLHNWHIDLISEYLEACERREIKRLIINIPPRFMKSIATSVAFPAWLLGRNPSEKIVVASYSSTLGLTHSTDCNLVMKSDWYQHTFPDTRISKIQDQKQDFKTDRQGRRFTTSVGGTVTGMGGNFLVVDDPHNPQQALSDVQRKTAITWYEQTFSSRLDDIKNGVMIVIMQRLHEQDLTGYLLEKGGYEHLKIPNEFEERTIYTFPSSQREIVKITGEFLHPERLGAEEANEKKKVSAYGYAGQYQQRPAPKGGGEFKQDWYSYYDNELSVGGMNIYIVVDPANEKKKTSDYTAMLVVGLASDHNYYLLDVVRDKLNPTERIDKLFQLHRKWNKKGGKPPSVGYEKYGLQSDIHYITQRQNETGYRFHVCELGGGQAKEDRIRRLIPILQNKRLYFPKYLFYIDFEGERVELVEQLINEFEHFPVGMHDDMVDGLARIVDEELNANFPTLQTLSNRWVDNQDEPVGYMGW